MGRRFGSGVPRAGGDGGVAGGRLRPPGITGSGRSGGLFERSRAAGELVGGGRLGRGRRTGQGIGLGAAVAGGSGGHVGGVPRPRRRQPMGPPVGDQRRRERGLCLALSLPGGGGGICRVRSPPSSRQFGQIARAVGAVPPVAGPSPLRGVEHGGQPARSLGRGGVAGRVGDVVQAGEAGAVVGWGGVVGGVAAAAGVPRPRYRDLLSIPVFDHQRRRCGVGGGRGVRPRSAVGRGVGVGGVDVGHGHQPGAVAGGGAGAGGVPGGCGGGEPGGGAARGMAGRAERPVAGGATVGGAPGVGGQASAAGPAGAGDVGVYAALAGREALPSDRRGG